MPERDGLTPLSNSLTDAIIEGAKENNPGKVFEKISSTEKRYSDASGRLATDTAQQIDKAFETAGKELLNDAEFQANLLNQPPRSK
jgi:hypothetical protein